VRHGVSRAKTGGRCTLGILFRDAAWLDGGLQAPLDPPTAPGVPAQPWRPSITRFAHGR